jgi:hypothetical protein
MLRISVTLYWLKIYITYKVLISRKIENNHRTFSAPKSYNNLVYALLGNRQTK